MMMNNSAIIYIYIIAFREVKGGSKKTIRKIWRLHILLMKRLLKISFHIFPAFRLHYNSNLIPVHRRLPIAPDLHHRPCILLAWQSINILVQSRIYFRCQIIFYLGAFYITLLENFCFFSAVLVFDIICCALLFSLYIFFCKSLS